MGLIEYRILCLVFLPVKLFGKHKFDFGMSDPTEVVILKLSFHIELGDQMIIRRNWEENKEGKI